MNDGSDGTLEWVRDQGFDYTYTPHNVGICLAMNMMRSKVKTDYICFVNDDMYVLPDWDKVLYEEIKARPDNRFFLSATTIQPHTHGCSILNDDFGDTVETFRENDLLNNFRKLQIRDWMGATLPPNVVHRDVWDLVGGYSVELSPGMYSDPDFTAKLWLCGIRYMKGLSASRVYHFETKSTSRIRKNMGQLQFLMKWGLTSSSFRKTFTFKGKDFDVVLMGTRNEEKSLKWQIIRSRIKAIYWLLTKDFGPLNKFWEKGILP